MIHSGDDGTAQGAHFLDQVDFIHVGARHDLHFVGWDLIDLDRGCRAGGCVSDRDCVRRVADKVPASHGRHPHIEDLGQHCLVKAGEGRRPELRQESRYVSTFDRI